MKKFLILIAFTVGLALAAGDSGKPPNQPIRTLPKPVDLDLTLDVAEEPEDPPPQQTAARASGAHGWIYWTLGATFAAGGLGWYFFAHQEKEPEVSRSELVFTDVR